MLMALMSVPALCASAHIDYDTQYCIKDKRSNNIYYVDWYVIQSDDSICFIDMYDGKQWLPANSYVIWSRTAV